MKNNMKNQIGNIITSNALNSDDGSVLIDKAIKHIKKNMAGKLLMIVLYLVAFIMTVKKLAVLL